MLYGRYCWSAIKASVLAFDLRLFLCHNFYNMTIADYQQDPGLRREITRDLQKTFRFRTAI